MKQYIAISVRRRMWVTPTLKLLVALARVGAVPLSAERISNLICSYGFKYYINGRRV